MAITAADASASFEAQLEDVVNRNLVIEKARHEWNQYADNWDSKVTLKVNNAMAKVVTEELKDILARGAVKGLDFGAGTGEMTFNLAHTGRFSEILAVDIAPRMVERITQKCKTRKNGHIVRTWSGDILSDEFHSIQDPESLDILVSGSSINLCPDLHATLKRFSELLRPGGAAIHFVWGPADTPNLHLQTNSRRDKIKKEMPAFESGISDMELRQELESSGLIVVKQGCISVPFRFCLPCFQLFWRYSVARKPI